jgi:hypothetical protein
MAPLKESFLPAMVHQFTSLADPDTIGQKYWVFLQSGASIWLLTTYKGQQFPGPTRLAEKDFARTQNPPTTGNFYISSTTLTVCSGFVAPL